MVRLIALVVLLGGCRQLLGFDSATAGSDAGPDVVVVNPDMPIDLPVDMPPGSETVTFQQGDTNGYQSAVDTWIDDGSLTNHATDQQLRVHKDNRWALVQFGKVFALDGGPIPSGATIVTATLRVNVQNVNGGGNNNFIHEVLVPWQDTVLSSQLGPTAGVTAGEDYESVPIGAGPSNQGPFTIEVTASIAKWLADPTTNHGWIIVKISGAGDDTFESSESNTAGNRPLLSVTYFP